MGTQGSNDDCYFYYYSSCAKGDECPFRHSESALGTETVCSSWREGRCYRDNCKFRHMESRIKRSTIPCYWENQPGGCRKPHCVFLHQKNRVNIHAITESQRLILPVQAGTPTPSTVVSDVVKESAKLSNHVIPETLPASENISVSPPSNPVEPVVVSFDEGEESDAESVSSTPVKSVPSKALNSGGTQMDPASNSSEVSREIDFGVKTLEQLRMEKIHRESEHFYKPDDSDDKVNPDVSDDVSRISALHKDPNMFCYPAYDKPLETLQVKINPESSSYKQAFYPPDSSSILSLSTDESPEENMSTSGTDIIEESQLSRDLRSKITKKRAVLTKVDIESSQKRVVNIKKPSNQTEGPLDFKIKTLSEIRKEKEKKTDDTDYSNPPSELVKEDPKLITRCRTNGAQVTGQRKIRRLFRDPVVLQGVNRNGETPAETDKSLLIEQLHQNGSCDKEAEESSLHVQKRKRPEKIIFSSEETSKKLKTEKTEHETEEQLLLHVPHIDALPNEILGSDHNVNKILPKKSQRPIIRRRSILTPAPSASALTSDKEYKSSSNHETAEVSDVNSMFQVVPNTEQESIVSSSDSHMTELEGRTTERSASIDEFDHLFLNDADMTLDDDDNTDKKAEDIFLEIEQMLES